MSPARFSMFLSSILASGIAAGVRDESKRRPGPYPDGMRGPGEHPPDEDCRGLCGAKACIDKAMAEIARKP